MTPLKRRIEALETRAQDGTHDAGLPKVIVLTAASSMGPQRYDLRRAHVAGVDLLRGETEERQAFLDRVTQAAGDSVVMVAEEPID